ncbi:50S ribosomal protein L25/general stress protein Ctc [Melissococcus plutonius]|uniref:Large ribosomal subunit protein bL25 n=1 Tax=Melissococcus plutonius (strain ATCC 35311 / DSM 29964 / CIP 104052 / LMG 20360 / NCIMB 702443) TaxID=940190 RepID=F3YC51_MELPT|nr:50S ribosomal protein L25/general stress protein Ctc [Melissococcus plutonius]AIM25324.1 50S ribosomal protein L25 [Melissococcus plutonius S1]KMT24022.1 50S ribosomal protein L25 [Melissococcus plutonius]KMT24176.1 50S ribosomal protein L25 [Melissococcus plutonius]KMT25521.1 50S ribosomal protein L25 [Melissococcus plutonius]KMT28667.1 50S ribosomal protein L25 [Melissococcus plutonius]
MSVSLAVKERAVRPRSIRNQLRRKGKVPAIVYGHEIKSIPIFFDEKELLYILHNNGSNVVITMTINNKKINTLLTNTQLDTFNKQMRHAEFLSVNMNEATEVETDVVLTGEASGVKAGGILTQNLYTILVSTTPEQLPENIEVDISNLGIGEAITVGDLPKNPTYELVTSPDEQIASVAEATTAPLGEETIENTNELDNTSETTETETK